MRRQFFMTVGLVAVVSVAAAADDSETTTSKSKLAPCMELPTGELSDAVLQKLAPDDSAGRVRIAWKTESQENTYGFNILRGDSAEGPYSPLNRGIIPGEGTTNVPKAYCFEDTGVERGRVYFYQIEEVTTGGEYAVVEGTAATRVKVKTVEEEREWMRKKAVAGDSK